MKKFWPIILFILLIIIFIKKDRIINYFKEEKYYNRLVKLHILKKCYNPSDDFVSIFAQEGLNYKELNQQVINDSLTKLAVNEIDPEYKVPSITHKIYFSSEENRNLSKFYIEEIKINYTKLNALDKWQHNIWTNKETIIPEEIKNIKDVKIRFVEEFFDHPLYVTLEELVKQGQEVKPYLAQASDLFRLIILQKYGGIYSDMDYEVYNPAELIKLMKNFDFIGGREHSAINSYYGNAFIAAKPNHPILNEAVAMSIRNYTNVSSAPDYIKYTCNQNDTLYFNGPPIVTISYFKKNNIQGNKDIILPPWMIFNVSFIRFKNQTCDINKIPEDFLSNQDSKIKNILDDFILNPEIIEAHKQDLEAKISDNIFYSWTNRFNYKIIGADMFCGSWTGNKKTSKKHYYWNFP